MTEKLFEDLQAIYPEMVEFRREMHMNPELSFQEVHTPKKIANYLRDLGLEVRTEVGGRGVVGKLQGEKPGKTIAFRADFDALPIQDQKNVDYKSTVDGAMHACGHDIHTASLLGAAKVLSQHKDKISGSIVFIHQFAEEQIPGGAISMIEDGCLDGVDEIYGAHVWTSIPLGTIGIIGDYAMAAGDQFDIEIIGKGGHGAKPHVTVDSIYIASQVLNQLHQIVGRQVDPLKTGVITVGKINGGQAFNIIAENTNMSGTVRTFDAEVRDTIEEKIKQVTTAVCEGLGGTANISYTRGYPALYNHPEPLKNVDDLAQNVVGKPHVKYLLPSPGMEDFAYYVKEVPGAFFFIGGANEEINAVYPNHHPKFDVDERCMLNAAKMFISLALQEKQGADDER
ncbi:M20 family metallopeptidase [Geomicrobium sp. JSM 1781026]|uniref:M20 metallopeptidase family protein n=1 Tax=Geomicrobium sp. JSM 1781026 TaxID=3344580 RepID=UPI0035C0FE9C